MKIEAVIFDCFGVVIVGPYAANSNKTSFAQVAIGEFKDQDLLQFVAALRKQYKTAMLSNVDADSLSRRLPDEELQEYFDTVVISGEIGYAKPEPEAYGTVADRLGVRLDACVFTDDREEFCEAARAVGMKAIHYKSSDQFKRELHELLAQAG